MLFLQERQWQWGYRKLQAKCSLVKLSYHLYLLLLEEAMSVR